jgi:hypothetical protein
MLDCFSFDPFSFQQDGLTAAEVDVGRRQIVDALVVAQVIVVGSDAMPTCRGNACISDQTRMDRVDYD